MKVSAAAFCTGGFCASLALLWGCGTPVPPAAPSNLLGPYAALVTTPDRSPSWVAPDAAAHNLLYVSDIGTGHVNIYSYPDGTLQGKLTGFKQPSGLCVDRSGDVFVTDLTAFKIYVFQRGAKTPMRILKDPHEDPGDCSVDPTTGNLAVSNVSTPNTGAGSVVVYQHARGEGKKYRNPHMFLYYFCGYDDRGNLYVDGTDDGNFALAVLPAGKQSFANIAVDRSIQFGGAVQWDGKNVAVGDYSADRIFRFKIKGTSGTAVGKTTLLGSKFAIAFWLQGSKVIGPNDESGNVMYWNYPAGGHHMKTIDGLVHPWGATISLAPK